MKLRALGVLSALTVLSCNPQSANSGDAGSDGAAADAAAAVYQRPTVPPGGILIESQEMTVPAGADLQFCMYTPVTVDHDVDTREMYAYQMPGGHHVILMYTMQPRTDAEAYTPHRCTDAEMISFRYLGGGDFQHAGREVLQFGTGLGLHIPAGAQLVLQSHYLNTSPTMLRPRDSVVVVPAPAGSVQHRVDSYAISDDVFSIPARSRFGRSVECTVQQDMNIVMLLGHEHEWGLHLSAQLFPANGGAMQMLYNESATGARLLSDPPIRRFTADNPLVFHRGDRVRINCDWENNTDRALEFPDEMCVGFMYYYPGTGWLVCGENNLVETRQYLPDGGAMVTTTDAATGLSDAAVTDVPSGG